MGAFEREGDGCVRMGGGMYAFEREGGMYAFEREGDVCVRKGGGWVRSKGRGMGAFEREGDVCYFLMGYL